jgi:tetratricopeptide (TPR) repeat protein
VTEAEALAALRGDDPAQAGRAAAALWQMWHQSGDPQLDALLHEGIEAVERQELQAAEAIFTRLIAAAPRFAEGWNKRATVRYLAKDYTGSIADCRETVSRNPNHFGALSGQGLCHLALGQHQEAATLFRRTLAVHPHLESARGNLRAVLSELVKGN